jgi:cell wall-associated NlpC family hydrolase
MSPERSLAYSRFVGVPYLDKGRSPSGWDCYGLYCYVMREVHGVTVPSHSDSYSTAELDQSVAAAFDAGRHGWRSVAPGDEQEGDGVVFNLAGRPLHCGLVIEPGTMLHALKGRDTVIERYRTLAWQKRIEGFYRWNS